jgi:DNA polymerase I-like protein with 3'-5' exonuclease and polymerase domains
VFVGHLNTPPPPEGYRPPTEFPMWGQSARRVIIDYETYDPDLKAKKGGKKLGSGFMRGNAFACGVGVRVEGDGGQFAEYYPMRHSYGENCEPEKVESWLRDNLANFRGELVGANSNLYDGFIAHLSNVRAPYAKWRDVQWAEPLLDENAPSFSLEALCKKYGLEGKVKSSLTDAYGKDWIKHFHEIHPGHARDYVLGDLDRPSQIIDKQIPLLREQGLYDLFEMESRLTPLLHYMKKKGVTVDRAGAENFNDELIIRRDAEFAKLSARVGFNIDFDNFQTRSALVKLFDTLGIKYPFTSPSKNYPNGQPSFTKAWLDGLDVPAARELTDARKYEKSRSTFVEGYILDCMLNGRIHADFHPCKYKHDTDDSDTEGGTETGRFSGSHPNLQNIPTRDPFLGPILRGFFLPNLERWWSIDLSQMEYRFLIHFASLARMPGALVARDAYRANPKTDFHQLTADLMAEPLVKVLLATVWSGVLPDDWKKLVRKIAKNINFGLVYGMGVDKLAVSLGLAEWNEEQQRMVATDPAKQIIETYHEMNPYIKPLNKLATNRAGDLGYIKTFLGRRRHFDLWEPAQFGKASVPYPYDEALRLYGDHIRRAGTHKALNSVLQGSNADWIKAVMVQLWDDGLFNENDTNDIDMFITVHDELDGSYIPSTRGNEAIAHVQHTMMHMFNLEVPVLAELGSGPNWSEAH